MGVEAKESEGGQCEIHVDGVKKRKVQEGQRSSKKARKPKSNNISGKELEMTVGDVQYTTKYRGIKKTRVDRSTAERERAKGNGTFLPPSDKSSGLWTWVRSVGCRKEG